MKPALAAALSTMAIAAAMASPAPTPPAAEPADAAGTTLSLSARKVYEQARSQLVQIRTVLKGRASQTSVGSGFFVTPEGHLVTNFHVVSQAALKPERHDLVYVTADGRAMFTEGHAWDLATGERQWANASRWSVPASSRIASS